MPTGSRRSRGNRPSLATLTNNPCRRSQAILGQSRGYSLQASSRHFAGRGFLVTRSSKFDTITLSMSYDPHSLEFRAVEPADYGHPVDLIEPLEQDEEIDIEGIGAIPLDAIRVILGCIVPSKPVNSRQWRTATARLSVLCHALDVADLGGDSLTGIAEQIGVSRALLSHRSVALRDYAGMRHEVSDAARQTYARRCAEVWDKRKFSTDDPTEQKSIWNK